MNNFMLILLFIGQITGILVWSVLVYILIEVVICKDARTVNTSRILSVPISKRIRLFKRSFRTLFYRGSLLLLVGSLYAILVMVNNLWQGVLPTSGRFVALSLSIPVGIIMIYRHYGHSVTWFDKLRLFFKDQHA